MVEMSRIFLNRIGITEWGRLRELKFYIKELEFFAFDRKIVYIAILQID